MLFRYNNPNFHWALCNTCSQIKCSFSECLFIDALSIKCFPRKLGIYLHFYQFKINPASHLNACIFYTGFSSYVILAVWCNFHNSLPTSGISCSKKRNVGLIRGKLYPYLGIRFRFSCSRVQIKWKRGKSSFPFSLRLANANRLG